MDQITCTRCGEKGDSLAKPPFRNELGERIQAEICQSCWADWLQHQTLLINHYGLDVRDPKARRFLYEKIEKLLLEGGTDEEIDTALEGQIEW
ncbi:MAG: oxidative damage protection protein [Longimicrobiales bacterium]